MEKLDKITRPVILNCNIHTVEINGEIWKGIVGLFKTAPYEIFVYKEDPKQEVFYIHPSKSSGSIIKGDFEDHKYRLQIVDKQNFAIIYEGLDRVINIEFHNLTIMVSHMLRWIPLYKVIEIIEEWKSLTDEQSKLQKVLIEILMKYL